MKIQFFVKQINTSDSTISEKYMFSKELDEIRHKDKVKDKIGKEFQVESLEWLDDNRTKLKAVCTELNKN